LTTNGSLFSQKAQTTSRHAGLPFNANYSEIIGVANRQREEKRRTTRKSLLEKRKKRHKTTI